MRIIFYKSQSPIINSIVILSLHEKDFVYLYYYILYVHLNSHSMFAPMQFYLVLHLPAVVSSKIALLHKHFISVPTKMVQLPSKTLAKHVHI